MKPIIRSVIVELPIKAGSTSQQVNFPAQPHLEGRVITAMSILSTATATKTINGDPLLNANAFKNAYLILKDNTDTEAIALPLVELEFKPDSAKRIEFAGQKIAWSKSGVRFGDTSAINATVEEIIQLTVFFQ